MSVLTETQNLQPLFTCISCSIGFMTAEDQRIHYRSDHHRYNMKRRIASLPPISAEVFNEKVLLRRAETAVTTSPRGATCEICSKVYTTENAYRSHLKSKKHKEAELKVQNSPRPNVSRKVSDDRQEHPETVLPTHTPTVPHADPEQPISNSTSTLTQEVEEEQEHKKDDEEEVDDTIDAKIAASRRRLTSNSCLFCPHQSASVELSMEHMTRQHSFFIPDLDYLRDLEGLLLYLGEKVAVGNVCLFCSGRSRDFRSMEAVWKHMTDKSHCKIAYDTQKDRLEISDFYDFSSSYPNLSGHASEDRRKALITVKESEGDGSEGEWEDVEEEEEYGNESAGTADEESSADDENIPRGQITYGDTEFELVLPSGARIGHRSLKRYYGQSFSSFPSSTEDPKSGAAIVRRLITDKRSDLIPVKGGFGAFGSGTQVIRARNRGEAREAGRHIREFRDQKRKEDYKTRVAFVHNHQKHYRDPLLQ